MSSIGSRVEFVLTGPWGVRILWVAIGASGMWSIGSALDGRSAATRLTVTVGAWLIWGIGVVALVVPSTLTLTIMRMLGALTSGAAVASWAGGASPTAGAVFLATTLVGSLLIGGADFGKRCVQASAYGDEHRYPLRPPAAFMLPMAIAGLVWVAAVLAAPLLLAASQWVVGVVVAVAAILLTILFVPRFNALSGRWLVLVPAGLVVHDQVVLGETLMVARADLADVDLALAGTEAADFTGPAGGHAVEVRLRSMATALLAPTKDAPRGRALHVQSFIVAPSRPGRVLVEFRQWTR